MSSFTEPVQLEAIEDKPALYRTVSGWDWLLNWNHPTERVEVPAGFETDGGSLPTRNMFALFNPFSAILIVLIMLLFRRFDSRMIKGFVSHDWLYKTREIKTVGGHIRRCTKKEADKILLDMIKIGGQRWIKRSKRLRKWRQWNYNVRCHIIYYALLLGGWWAWFGHRWRERKTNGKSVS